MTVKRVAALYVDPKGPYPRLLGPKYCWDAERDARLYAGPWPIVAHPPCGPWGRLAHLAKHDDPSLAPIAVEQVRRWGGVLEHPEYSRLFRVLRLPFPDELPDACGGYTIAVDQCDFGHVARKKTWLYIVGVPRVRFDLPAPREPTHQVGVFRFRDASGTLNWGGHLKHCSAEQRRRTPLAFAVWLVGLARLAARPVCACAT